MYLAFNKLIGDTDKALSNIGFLCFTVTWQLNIAPVRKIKSFFFFNIVFDEFAGLFLVAILRPL